MRLLIASTVSAVVILSASSAMAADANWSRVYLRLDTGGSFPTDDYDNSAIISGGVGYRFNDRLRADVTLGYRGWYGGNVVWAGPSANGAKADISSFDGLANLYYDFGKFGFFTPYVGGGMGFASNTVSNYQVFANGAQVSSSDDHTETDFAWQLSAGTAVDVAPNLAIDVGYRYFDAGSLWAGWPGKSDLTAHELQVGLRYSL
ncbi:outer membrane protein [Telmatospirillum siberiense]|uniref:Outer membrane protein beta-barrel domain-containing protein n=1 Tax=Telmatospirillum siberiense TaxID=382514 RepID=A0A2N3PPA9_9PROT|nr:outer membrane beta-barrel protein [Telmatospirillum siberiense]PKU22240.1 hypothetical protein CWS72_22495 [Telmatospirillum siberiense]